MTQGKKRRSCIVVGAVMLVAALIVAPAVADETCQSPFLPKVTGQEDYAPLAAEVQQAPFRAMAYPPLWTILECRPV